MCCNPAKGGWACVDGGLISVSRLSLNVVAHTNVQWNMKWAITLSMSLISCAGEKSTGPRELLKQKQKNTKHRLDVQIKNVASHRHASSLEKNKFKY